MKFFLDTANLDEIREATSTGILDGITTNPSLIAKEGNSFEDQLLKICSIIDGPVSAEAVSRDAEGMVQEGRSLASIHPNIVVKCPFTLEGLKATKALSDDNLTRSTDGSCSGSEAPSALGEHHPIDVVCVSAEA